MRKLRRWWQGRVSEWRIAARRAEVLRTLRDELGLPALSFRLAGHRGHDSNYIVSAGGVPVGVLRLANPYRRRPSPPPSSPFILLPQAQRLSREWDCLAAGAPQGLTPQPLWRASDALFCAYLPHRPLQERLAAKPQDAWLLAAAVCARIAALHRAGITHMDMSLANTLGDAALAQVFFVDFEYAPAQNLPPSAQRLYDHLRLIESGWKFIPESLKSGYAPWLAAFAAAAREDVLHYGQGQAMSVADLAAIGQALPRVMAARALTGAVAGALAQAAA